MEKKFKLGVIGCGFMSTSILKGIIEAQVLNGKDIIVSDVNESQFEKLNGLGVETTLNSKFLADNCEFLLLAVKPQNLKDVLTAIECSSVEKFISILAGTKKAKIKEIFPSSKVARCMPNTPCSIRQGAIAVDASEFSEDDKQFIVKMFSSFADVLLMDETKMNAVTGISGSGPAYVYLFIDGLIKAGINEGLSEDEARILAVQTVIGSGFMVKQNKNLSVESLVTAVCSKGGTTIEAVKVFNDNNFKGIIADAVSACVNRAEELENI